jgi:hypothetical protein
MQAPRSASEVTRPGLTVFCPACDGEGRILAVMAAAGAANASRQGFAGPGAESAAPRRCPGGYGAGRFSAASGLS